MVRVKSRNIAFLVLCVALSVGIWATSISWAEDSDSKASHIVTISDTQQGMVIRSAGRHVIKWDFGRSNDQNYDAWPDGWKRRTGRGYPNYLEIGLTPHNATIEKNMRLVDSKTLPYWQTFRRVLRRVPSRLPMISSALTGVLPAIEQLVPPLPPSATNLFVDQYLRINLDGGGAMLQSQAIPISNMYSYSLSVSAKCEGLQHDRCWAELVFFDQTGAIIDSMETKRITGTTSWKPLNTIAIAPPPKSDHAVIRMRVEPNGDYHDIHGTIGFDNLKLTRYPQLRLSTDSPQGLHPTKTRPIINVRAYGLRDTTTEVRITLLDVYRNVVTKHSFPVTLVRDPKNPGVLAGISNWKVPLLKAGFYRAIAILYQTERASLETEITFAITTDFPSRPSPFGWTFADGSKHSEYKDMPAWLEQCHVGRIKYPCWTAPDDQKAIDALTRFMVRVQQREIDTVGLLMQPPPGVANEIYMNGPASAAMTFQDFGLLQPLLEPMMNRVALRVSWWQLGHDQDFSFVSGIRVKRLAKEIQSGMQSFGQPLKVAIPWPWTEPIPAEAKQIWNALNRSDATSLTASELNDYLASLKSSMNSSEGLRNWIALNPLPASQYSTSDRVRDLIFRMATVRKHRVDAAFVSAPYDSQVGLLQANGTPAEMLLPWRTLSALLGSLRQVGSLQLPEGSDNIIFSDGKHTLMMVWNDQPTTETLYLGENVEVVDIWGERQPAANVLQNGRVKQQIQVQGLPRFVIGLDTLVNHFRMGVKLETESIDSWLGRSQTIDVSLRNPHHTPLSGDAALRGHEAWDYPKENIEWQVRPNAIRKIPLQVTLLTNAVTGDERVNLDFNIHTSPPKHFTVYRDIHVGPIDLDVRILSRLNERGELVVLLEMHNKADQDVLYNCRLFPLGRQYQRQFLSVPSGETIQREFMLRDGKELLGSTLMLRAADENGPRVLNYAVVATP